MLARVALIPAAAAAHHGLPLLMAMSAAPQHPLGPRSGATTPLLRSFDTDVLDSQRSANVLMSFRGGGIAELSPSRVTLLGAVMNVLLSLLKFAVGTTSGSMSLVADAYHSGSDLAVDAVTMAAVNAPPAFERAATLAIAALLASAGFTMVWSAAVALWRRVVPTAGLGTPPLLVALVCIGTKEVLFRVTRAVGRRTRQQVLIASAKHHRSDAMSSFAAAIGSGGVLLGLPIADTIAAGVVGGMMVAMGAEVALGDHDEHH